MRIRLSTWNINGLRSSFRKGFQDWLSKGGHDIVCLQEVKSQPDLLGDAWFPGYKSHWFSAERSGYSGVVTIVSPRLVPVLVRKGIGDPMLDGEGRVLSIEFPEFEVLNVYAPHSHRELKRLDVKLRFLELLGALLRERRGKGKPLLIAGDFNIAHEERDIANFAANRKNAGFLPQERQWLDGILSDGFRDAFRVFCADRGHYTWWSPLKGVREKNVGWRLDYILVDDRLADGLETCFHSPEQLGSDHCPVTVVFNTASASRFSAVVPR
jgi:exodeoxyribonuclease III